MDALRKIGSNSSRVRTVLPGDSYELPPGQEKLDLFAVPLEEVMAALKAQPADSRLDKALLAVCMGFGPVSAKEVCFSAGLAPSIRLSELEDVDYQAVSQGLSELLELTRAETLHPTILMDENKKILAMASFPLHYLPEAKSLDFDTISQLLERADLLYGSYVLPDKDRFQKLVKNELNKAENKLVKLDKEIEEAENAELYRRRGDNLMTYQYQFRDREDPEITVADIYSETGEEITIPLDQRFTLVENMQACYKKYDKLKRGKEMLQDQRRDCELSISYLESIEASLLASSSLAEISEIHNELVNGGYLREKLKKKNNDKPATPFRFTAPDGTVILVGKNNYQNDKLTFKTANHNDLWLHTKDIPGSHVILRCGGTEPAEETLLLAAELAVYFSKARGSSTVPVDYVEVRRVKKPSGAKPGFVIFTEQSTLYITPDEEKLGPVLAQDPAAF